MFFRLDHDNSGEVSSTSTCDDSSLANAWNDFRKRLLRLLCAPAFGPVMLVTKIDEVLLWVHLSSKAGLETKEMR